MKHCINEATTMSSDFEDDVRAYSEAGFQAIELKIEKVEKFIACKSIEVAKRLLEKNNLKAVCAGDEFGLMLTVGEERDKTLKEFEKKLFLCPQLWSLLEK